MGTYKTDHCILTVDIIAWHGAYFDCRLPSVKKAQWSKTGEMVKVLSFRIELGEGPASQPQSTLSCSKISHC